MQNLFVLSEALIFSDNLIDDQIAFFYLGVFFLRNHKDILDGLIFLSDQLICHRQFHKQFIDFIVSFHQFLLFKLDSLIKLFLMVFYRVIVSF